MQNQSEEKNSESMSVPKIAETIGLGLLLSNETWEHVIDASQAFIALVSPDLKILKANTALSSFPAFRHSELTGRLYYEALHGLNEPHQECQSILSGKKQKSSVHTEDACFGSVTLTQLSIYNEKGVPAGFLHIIEPVSTPAQSGDAVQGMQALVDAFPGSTLICNELGIIQCASDSFARMIGIGDFPDFVGSHFVTFLSHDELEAGLRDFSQVISGTVEGKTGHFRVRFAGQEPKLKEITMKRMGGSVKAQKEILMNFREVTDLQATGQSPAKNQVRMQLLINSFQGLSADPESNIQRLLTLTGELTSSSSCRLSLLSDEGYRFSGAWNSPFAQGFDHSLPEKILLAHASNNPGDIQLLSRPQLTTFLKKYPELQERNGLKSLLGIPLYLAGRYFGLLTLSFSFQYELNDSEREFLHLASSALSMECSRLTGKSLVSGDAGNEQPLLDFLTDSICIMDTEGRIIMANEGANRMYGYEREEMTGMQPENLSAPERNDMDSFRESVRKAFQGETCEFEWWGLRKNGEVFPKAVVLNKGQFGGKEVVIAIGRDMTAYKQAEEKLQKSNLELKEINQSKDKFFSILAHDLKNPFGGLLGFIDLLYEDIDELSSKQVKEYLQNIRTASYHTYSLLENLLEWSRIQTGKVKFQPTRFDISEEVEMVIRVLEANAIRKNIRLVNQVETGIMALADRNMIHSVIQNLTSNAIKFSNSNNAVTITGRMIDAGLAVNEHTDESLAGRKWYELSVTDTGIGIPDDILPKLFRLDGQFSMAGTANEPGTGLGLILCKEMVEKNGGRIKVESRLSNGSTFSFTLPLSE